MERTESTDSSLSPTEVEAALGALSGPDWARATSLARMAAAGLPNWTADDLLQETLTKLLEGERVWRRGVHPLVTLKVAMHGIASNERKKEKNGPIDHRVTVDDIDNVSDDAKVTPSASAINEITPENAADGRSQIEYLEKLVADAARARQRCSHESGSGRDRPARVESAEHLHVRYDGLARECRGEERGED